MVEEIVTRMRTGRELRGVKREEIAYKLNVTVDTVGNWERNEGNGPPLWAVVGYARVLGIGLGEILGQDVSSEAMDRVLLQQLRAQIEQQSATIASLLKQLP